MRFLYQHYVDLSGNTALLYLLYHFRLFNSGIISDHPSHGNGSGILR